MKNNTIIKTLSLIPASAYNDHSGSDFSLSKGCGPSGPCSDWKGHVDCLYKNGLLPNITTYLTGKTATGKANIDLTGTGFIIDRENSALALIGSASSGNDDLLLNANQHVLNISGCTTTDTSNYGGKKLTTLKLKIDWNN